MEIDQLVYKMYGLTEDEIKIVRGKFPRSKVKKIDRNNRLFLIKISKTKAERRANAKSHKRREKTPVIGFYVFGKENNHNQIITD